MKKLGMVLVGALALGCGGGDSGGGGGAAAAGMLVGGYQVTSHFRNDASCSDAGSAVTEFSHFELREGEPFFGVQSMELYECTDATTCDSNAGRFFLNDGSGWVLETTYQSGSSASCNIGATSSALTATDTGVAIDTETREGAITIDTGLDCLDIEVEDFIDQVGCSLESIEGTRL
jgi:hypothetical protein